MTPSDHQTPQLFLTPDLEINTNEPTYLQTTMDAAQTVPETPPPTRAPAPVIVWKNIPLTPDHQIRIAGPDLPHVIPGANRIPPCTIRYILPSTTNTKFTHVTDTLRMNIFGQLYTADPLVASEAQVTFPPTEGSRGAKEVLMDVTLPTPELFSRFQTLAPTFVDGDTELLIKGTGPPVPANVMAVSISNLGSQIDEISVAKEFFEALNRYRPEEIEVCDIYTRYMVFPEWPQKPKFCGSIHACVLFKNSPPNVIPDSYVINTFPGYIRLRH
jgi:hypothetical protein